jgi:hypothetical protein
VAALTAIAVVAAALSVAAVDSAAVSAAVVAADMAVVSVAGRGRVIARAVFPRAERPRVGGGIGVEPSDELGLELSLAELCTQVLSAGLGSSGTAP